MGTHTDPKPTEERRRFHRFDFEAKARLYSGSQQWDTELIDISLKGVLLRRPEDWDGDPGELFRVEVKLEGGVVISMSVIAAHVTDDRAGFHCERIDMDSFGHLKRLIELNLGDPSLLTRELSALG